MSIEYVGWADHDKTYHVTSKLHDALDNFRAKRNQEPNVVMVHPETAKQLQNTQAAMGVDIREARYIGRNDFYVGREEQDRAAD